MAKKILNKIFNGIIDNKNRIWVRGRFIDGNENRFAATNVIIHAIYVVGLNKFY